MEKSKPSDASGANLSASGSATGNPRNKVALKPGCSLMDWIRLTHSGEDLTGVGGVSQSVTIEQLAEHNTESDCWLAVRGTVFNVSRYMEFHPGGRDQLMRGAGKDATQLFDEIHAYVNYSSLLQKCIVGQLIVPESPRTNSEPSSPKLPTNPEPVFKPPAPASKSPASKASSSVLLPLDWYQTEDAVHIVFYTKIPEPGVRVVLLDRDLSARLTLNARCVESSLTLLDDVRWPCKITISHIGKVDIELLKVTRRQWSGYGSPCHGSLVAKRGEETQAMVVVEKLAVTHDTELIVLRHDAQCYQVVPIGWHIQLHFHIDGMEVSRAYTPVPPCLVAPPPSSWRADCVCLMVKSYVDGAVSPLVRALGAGDSVRASGPHGTFSTVPLRHRGCLHLVAAGTGITPMLGVAHWALTENTARCKSVRLLFFNRASRDILWRDQLDALSASDERFTVTHVLSEPEPEWHGLTGRVDDAMLARFLAEVDCETERDYICVCGPILFTEAVRELLVGQDFSSEQFHCFIG